MFPILRLGSIALGLSLLPALSAASITFTTAGISCFNASGGGACNPGVNNIWNTNDYLEQTFTATGLGAVNQLSLSLFLNNSLGNGVTSTWDVLVNSVAVGSFSRSGPPSGTAPFAQTYNFAAIAGAGSGSDYTVRFQVSSPSAALGTIGLPTDLRQSGTLLLNSIGPPPTAPVPEPSAMALTGLALMAVAAKRRLR